MTWNHSSRRKGRALKASGSTWDKPSQIRNISETFIKNCFSVSTQISEFPGNWASRTGIEPVFTAVKEKRFTVIQRNFAARIALCRTQKTHGNAYWTLNGGAFSVLVMRLHEAWA